MFTPISDYQDLRLAVKEYFTEEDIHPDAMPMSLKTLAVSAQLTYDYDTQTWEFEE